MASPSYLGTSETKFNKCSADNECPCTYFKNGHYFQYRVTGINCTSKTQTENGVHTYILAAQNCNALNVIEESSISSYSSKTTGSIIYQKYGYISIISINESNCETNWNVGYVLYNDPLGISCTKFCQFISNDAVERCYSHCASMHSIQCSNYVNSTSSSTTTSWPGIIYLEISNSMITIFDSVIKDNSGIALIFSDSSDTNIIVDRCIIDNPKIEAITGGRGKIKILTKNMIPACLYYAEFRYKTICEDKFCKCSSDSFVYFFTFFSLK